MSLARIFLFIQDVYFYGLGVGDFGEREGTFNPSRPIYRPRRDKLEKLVQSQQGERLGFTHEE